MFVLNPFVSFPAASAPTYAATATGVSFNILFESGFVVRCFTDQASEYTIAVPEPGSNTLALTLAAIRTELINDGNLSHDSGEANALGSNANDFAVTGAGTLSSATVNFECYTGSLYHSGELITVIELGYGATQQSGTDAVFS